MNNIRLLRKKKNISMKQLGEAMGVAESTISLYETEKREPDIQTIIKIAKYFGVTIDYLIGRTDNSTTEWTDDEKALGITDKARIEVNTRQYKWLELGDEVYDTKGEQYYNVICDMIKASIEHK